MNPQRRHVLAQAGIALAAATPLWAQASTDTPVRLVVPFAPGGPGDFTGRLAALHLAKTLGQPVIVENKPGANGNIGAQQVVDAPADGGSILLNTVGMQAINPLLYPQLRYSPGRDLVTLGIASVVPNVLVVHPDKLGVNTVAELVALARRQPGRLTYATFGGGSSSHLYGAMFLRAAGIEAVPVPYKGSAPASADVMAGNVDFLFDSLTTSVGLIQGRKLKGLAVTAGERLPLVPDVPTMQQAGLPAVDLKFWLSLQVHARTPAPVLARLRQALYQAMLQPEYQAALTARGAEALVIEPARVHQQVLADAAQWLALGQSIGIRPV
ncbi:ABC transporter substrate-binding protein [Comamonas serinivorans]|uniref:ABC transporter substrate-binding protein n=1 Tax=Comamonas serinivorans TaxID=1082851 RepID=A0A1Y0ETY4_9BURK|nr:tripartite tricarboxylate transporter substrate binding protein [Comamonas serinivorans]ARU06829.1 ABC transporter substrate-binding protein [Comamonas serinivorans]